MASASSQNAIDKYKVELSTSDFPLSYVRRQAVENEEMIWCIEIPWPLIRKWNELMKLTTTKEDGITYIDLLNASVPDHSIAVKRDCARINERLRVISVRVGQSYRKASGRKWAEIENKSSKLCIKRGETESVQELKSQQKQDLDEIDQWKMQYSNLEKEMGELFNELVNARQILETKYEDIQNKNQQLREYIDTLERQQSLQCQGKKFSEVGPKQQCRKLKALKGKVQCALWFCQSYGLELSEFKVKDSEGFEHAVSCNGQDGTDGTYASLTQEDKHKLESVLYLLDKFCVGDDFYHELTITTHELPKSYLVKQMKHDLNQICHIERTPGLLPGAQFSSFEAILQQSILDFFQSGGSLSDSEPIKVKLSGDGARMSRSTNFMIFSFSLLQLGEKVMSPYYNRSVAIVNGPEKYETLKSSFGKILTEVNNLIDKGRTTVSGRSVDLEFFLGGDMKFLLMMMGLSGATSQYACLWCKIAKQERHDMTKAKDFYCSEPVKRTLQEIKDMSKLKSNNFCCIHKPLLNIELDHVILDELHLLLRITDRLLENVLTECEERDSTENFIKTPKERCSNDYMKMLVKVVNQMGITFSVWNKRNADGSLSNQQECTSLLGSQKKKLLKELPLHLHKLLYPDTCSVVVEIWTKFDELYDMLTNFELESSSSTEVHKRATAWIDLFCSLGGKRMGYERPRVTPYMHCLAYHIPKFIEDHGCLKKFTGQGVERNNDCAKKIFFQKSNKWDGARDILTTENRQFQLKNHERERGTYVKRKLEYWNEEIHKLRQEKRAKFGDTNFSDDAMQETESPDTQKYQQMKAAELRRLIRERGIRVKGLSKLKKEELVSLLKQHESTDD